jgi:hypothetical protein
MKKKEVILQFHCSYYSASKYGRWPGYSIALPYMTPIVPIAARIDNIFVIPILFHCLNK